MSNINSGFDAVAEALHKFWSAFNIPAFVQNALPKSHGFPYILYTFSSFCMFSRSVESATIFTYSSNFEQLNSIISDISHSLPTQGILIKLPLEFGCIRLSRAEPFCQVQPNSDNMTKARLVSYELSTYVN